MRRQIMKMNTGMKTGTTTDKAPRISGMMDIQSPRAVIMC